MATHYTPIPNGTGVANTSSLFNTRLEELDTAIVNIESGAAAINATKYNTPSTLTLDSNSSGAITINRTRHFIDTKDAAASGDLITINGGTDGQLIILQSVSAARVVYIKRNGNIYFPNNANVALTDPKMLVTLIYDGTSSKWIGQSFDFTSLRENLSGSATEVTQLDIPDRTLIAGSSYSQKRLGFSPSPEVSNMLGVRAAAATLSAAGMAVPTIANSPSNANDNTTVWLAMPTTASAGNLGGFASTTFNLVRRDHNPVFYAIVKTDSAIASTRLWVGLGSADVTNSDTASGHFVGFRYSTGASDTTWKAVVRDGTTQNTNNVGSTVATSTVYVLRCRVDSANGIAYFSVNGSAEVALSTNLPASGTDLGMICRPIAVSTTVITLNLSRFFVEGA